MDISSITQVISNFGFPIAVCGVLFYYIYKLQYAHNEEITALREAIENNTLALTKLELELKGNKDV